MKKYGIMILIVFLLCGCNKKTKNDVKTNIHNSNTYYQIAEPYKSGVSKTYVTNNILNNYDVAEVESSLMDISAGYFSYNNSYYQAGQYLKESELIKLLSKEEYNRADKIIMDGVEINPTYFSYIYEQNYLGSNGDLKGISLAIVLNPYQKYQNYYGAYLYKSVDEAALITNGKEKATKLVSYMRKKKGLEHTKIVVALYVQNRPNEVLPGRYKYVGVTTNDEISFEPIEYEYQYLDSNYVVSHDIDTYNMFQNLEKEVSHIFPNAYTMGTGQYVSGRLETVEMNIQGNYLSKSELLMLTQTVSRVLTNAYHGGPTVHVYIKENNNNIGLIRKEKNSSKCNVYIMKG